MSHYNFKKITVVPTSKVSQSAYFHDVLSDLRLVVLLALSVSSCSSRKLYNFLRLQWGAVWPGFLNFRRGFIR